MAEQDEKQKQIQGPEEQPEQEKQTAPESAVWELPNSVMAGMPTPPPPPETPNSVMREMLGEQNLSGDAAGNRFPAGFVPGMPNSVMREMDNRGGYDFSSLQFQVNSANSPQDEFAPSLPSHELSHNFRQKIVPNHVSLSVPGSVVQRDPGNRNKKSDPKPGSTSENSVNEETFKGLFVKIDGKWTEAATAEAKIRSEREEARRNSPTTTTTVQEEDPNVPPQSKNNGEVLRDNVTKLWVERAGEKLFVYIDGSWIDAVERDSLPQGEIAEDQSSSESGENLIDMKPREDSGKGDNGDIIGNDEPLTEDAGESNQSGRNVVGRFNINSREDAWDAAGEIFGMGSRWRFFSKPLTDDQIDGMAALYKFHAGSDVKFPTEGKIVAAPINSALSETNNAVDRASGGADKIENDGPLSDSLSGSPQKSGNQIIEQEPDLIAERGDQDQVIRQVPKVLSYGRYRGLGAGWKTSKKHLGNSMIAQNIGMGASAFGRQGVLLNNYQYHVSQSAKNNLPIWDQSKWKLPTSGNPVKDSNGHIVSSGEYDPYVNYVAPITGAALSAYGVATGFTSMVHGLNDTIRNRQNVAAGASRWDAAQSGLDTVAAASSTMSSAWGLVQNIGNIAGPATSTFGDAAHAVPGLSIVSGAANAISGTAQAIRGRKTRSELNAAGKLLDEIEPPEESNNSQSSNRPLTDQEKLRMIMKQGHKTAVFNMWSGGLKAVSGGLTAASGIASLVGAAPVAAGIQGVAAVLNIARTIFERVYKSKMRNSIVAEEYNINWDKEMKAVYAMIKRYNSRFSVRDKDVRRVILKAHGSKDATRTAAYNTIKLNRAQYLINVATDRTSRFQKVADMVIEAMGVHKINGKNYAAGAAKLLAEKLG